MRLLTILIFEVKLNLFYLITDLPTQSIKFLSFVRIIIFEKQYVPLNFIIQKYGFFVIVVSFADVFSYVKFLGPRIILLSIRY